MANYDHWLPLHIGDYVADTMHLSTLQHGIYIRLIMHYWKHRGLPHDVASLAQISGLTPARFLKNSEAVLLLFSDGLKHKRLEAELEKIRKISDLRAEAGKAGADARWQKPFSTRTRATPQPQPEPEEALARFSQARAREGPHNRPDRNAAFDVLREMHQHENANGKAYNHSPRMVDITRSADNGKRKPH